MLFCDHSWKNWEPQALSIAGATPLHLNVQKDSTSLIVRKPADVPVVLKALQTESFQIPDWLTVLPETAILRPRDITMTDSPPEAVTITLRCNACSL